MLGLPFTPLEFLIVGLLFTVVLVGVICNLIVALAEWRTHRALQQYLHKHPPTMQDSINPVVSPD